MFARRKFQEGWWERGRVQRRLFPAERERVITHNPLLLLALAAGGAQRLVLDPAAATMLLLRLRSDSWLS